MKLKLSLVILLGYGIVFSMFLRMADLFRIPTMYSRTSEEVEDLCKKPDLNQPQFGASQLSWTMLSVNPSSLLAIAAIILFIMVIITISRVAWTILSKVGEKVKIEFKTEDEEMHRLQNFSIEEHSYLSRKLIEVLEEKTELTKQITVLTNEYREIKTQNTYLFQQCEALTEELNITKTEFQSLLERSQAAEAKFREFSRILAKHKEIENKILDLDLTLDNEVVKLTKSLSKFVNQGQQPLSSELEYSTESSEQLLEIDDKNDNCMLKSMDMPCGETKRPPSTRCSDANLNAVTESEMDLLEKLKGVEERFGVSILNSNYLDHSTLQAIFSYTNQSREKLEELELNAEDSTMDSEEHDIQINEILEPKFTLSGDQRKLNELEKKSGNLTTIYEKSEGSTYETLEAISSISISGNSNDALNTTQSQSVNTISENSIESLNLDLNNTQSQVKIDSKRSTAIMSDEYEKRDEQSSHEILKEIFSKIRISENSTDALNNTESKTKMNVKNSTTIISDEYDNASYATFESAVTSSGNLANAEANALNTTQAQVKLKEFEANLRNSTTIISDGGENDNSSYETLESAITSSGNSTDDLNATQVQSTLTRNNSEWETESIESSPETPCWYQKFVEVTRKYIIEPPKIQDTLSVTLPKHLGNMRNRLTTTDKFGPTTQLVQEPKGLVTSSIAFKNFMKNLNELNAPEDAP
ncbi:unnamed protein product [Ceutorhynchus assimilis]|uniref:Uncharacterized protein n=1 Tax=Ceutorhynchus assimilis TaxID=467358 RepID=A0A9N9QJ30_9CUCU|nr:unnamed protein product [Ceutorhynchus assimilis]